MASTIGGDDVSFVAGFAIGFCVGALVLLGVSLLVAAGQDAER